LLDYARVGAEITTESAGADRRRRIVGCRIGQHGRGASAPGPHATSDPESPDRDTIFGPADVGFILLRVTEVGAIGVVADFVNEDVLQVELLE
jgi:hypothetical protein